MHDNVCLRLDVLMRIPDVAWVPFFQNPSNIPGLDLDLLCELSSWMFAYARRAPSTRAVRKTTTYLCPKSQRKGQHPVYSGEPTAVT